jgi:hypothetical protein
MVEIKAGDRFSATIRKGEHSKTFGGEEKAGKFCGTFIATGVSSVGAVESGERIFRRDMWWLKKVDVGS